MPVWRYLLAAVACAGVFGFLGVFISVNGESPGPDVAAIAHGLILIGSLIIAGLCAVAALMFVLWENRLVRYCLISVVVGPPFGLAVWLGVATISNYLQELSVKRELASLETRRATLEAGVRPIADGYLEQMYSPTFAVDDLPELRRAFTEGMNKSGIVGWRNANAAFYFDVHADLYGYVFAPSSTDVPARSIGSGLLHDAACFEFSNHFSPDFSEEQAQTFDALCPSYKIEAGPRAMEIVR